MNDRASAGAPIIVTALFADADHAYLDGLRREHFPHERNQLSAHLTMFHHLPPSLEGELKARLAEVARGPPPSAELASLMSLGRGVAFRVQSPDLEAIRSELAEAFRGLLTPQDASGWRPHVTIQNKADPVVARELLNAMEAAFQPKSLAITGLAAFWYRGGPWDLIRSYPFRGC